MRFLFLFLDGVGLGPDDSEYNPFARVAMPSLHRLLNGASMLAKHAPLESGRATLIPLDANLDVPGLPQSATGQAALLTGHNVPAEIGYHYGPKPNPEVAAWIKNGNIFSRLLKNEKKAAFLNAYPPSYFQAIQSGRRLYAAIPLAAVSAGIPLRSVEDLRAGEAVSADFTGEGWRTHLGLKDTPMITAFQAGERLAMLSQDYDFAFYEYWLSDYVGHSQEMSDASRLLTTFDRVLEGLLQAWDDEAGLILLTSDHGNLEDLRTRRHTNNPVPALLIGAPRLRKSFTKRLKNLTDITPAILRLLLES